MSLAVPDVMPPDTTAELAVPVVVAAPAKINLYLHVLGRRDDGYHLLDSLAVFTDVGDTLEVSPAEELELIIEGPFAEGLSTGPDNLVIRAAERLAAQWADKLCAGRARLGAHLKLTKRLPVASGIGGGSADAAATLRALSALWSVTLDTPPLSGKELDQIALSLGADVPVCLRSTASFMTGVGEEIDPAPPLPAFWLVLVNPGVAVPTASVFKRRRGPFSESGRFSEPPATAEALALLLQDRTNDLMPPALEVAPVIGEVIEALAATQGCLFSRMSGSGATCFGVFADEGAARTAAEVLGDKQPAWWVSATSVAGA